MATETPYGSGDAIQRSGGHISQKRHNRPLPLAYLIIYLLNNDLVDGLLNDIKHELHEGGAVRLRLGGSERIVALKLVLGYHRLQRQPFEKRVLAPQKQRVPEPSRTSVAVREGVNTLELTVKETRDDERVNRGGSEPSKEVCHNLWNKGRGRPGMHQLLARKDSNITRPKASRTRPAIMKEWALSKSSMERGSIAERAS